MHNERVFMKLLVKICLMNVFLLSLDSNAHPVALGTHKDDKENSSSEYDFFPSASQSTQLYLRRSLSSENKKQEQNEQKIQSVCKEEVKKLSVSEGQQESLYQQLLTELKKEEKLMNAQIDELRQLVLSKLKIQDK